MHDESSPGPPSDDDRDWRFTISGTVTARDQASAVARIRRTLTVLGFRDVGDGTLWLDRPSGPRDDLGMALGEIMLSVDDLGIEPTDESSDA
jgi:hypothetical protein